MIEQPKGTAPKTPWIIPHTEYSGVILKSMLLRVPDYSESASNPWWKGPLLQSSS